MRYRVERARADRGFGWGWVVLDADGELIAVCTTWERAMHRARATAIGMAL